MWMLDKRAMHDPTRPVDVRPIVALMEADVKQTTRLRHPGVVSVIAAMEESKTHLMWVSEEVSGSLMSWMHAAATTVCPHSASVTAEQMSPGHADLS